ncbi:MAG: MBL fold metallo-hydrolase [Pseudomonadota bacterium]
MLVIIRLSLVLLLFLPVSLAVAQEQDRKPSHCHAVAQNTPGSSSLHKASFRDPVPKDRARLHYIDHASFLIQGHNGSSAVTDFSGFIGTADFIPDVVTMNKAHVTHWTAFPDPAIPNVLPGWGEDYGSGIEHYVDLGDMVVRNVNTDVVSPFTIEKEPNANSIFVFEVAGLCIGHLGHLHHEPTPEQYAALGRIDVVMAPVDGGFTMPLDQMIRVIKRLRSSIVIPMHWFDSGGLFRFTSTMEEEFRVIEVGGPELIVSLDTLPSEPTVMVLLPRFLNEP